jgi:hypothetical protein
MLLILGCKIFPTFSSNHGFCQCDYTTKVREGKRTKKIKNKK